MANLPLVPGYRIQEQIGEGAEASVYLAADPSGAPLALKLFRVNPDKTGQSRQAFFRELDALCNTLHPNLAGIVAFGTTVEARQDYISFAYHDGCDFLSAAGTGSAEGFIYMAMQVCLALEHLHRRGFIHGDLKSKNILVDSQLNVKVVDLSHSSRRNEPSHPVRGTVAYLAPEVIDGLSPTPASDLYALGVLLYQSLAGRPPFAATSIDRLLDLHRTHDVPSIPDRILPELHPLISQLLAKSPERRPPSAHAVFKYLSAFAAPERSESLHISPWPYLARSADLVGFEGLFRMCLGAIFEHTLNSAVHLHHRLIVIEGAKGTGKSRFVRELARQSLLLGAQVSFLPSSILSDPQATLDFGTRIDLLVSDIPTPLFLQRFATFSAALKSASVGSVLVVTVDPSASEAPFLIRALRQVSCHPAMLLRLPSLGVSHISAMASSLSRNISTDRWLADTVWRFSGGNPMLACELLASWLPSGAPASTDDLASRGDHSTPDPTPSAVREWVRAQLSSLGLQDLSLLALLASAPTTLDDRAMADLSKQSLATVRQTRRRLERKQLIRTLPSTGTLTTRTTVACDPIKNEALTLINTQALRKIYQRLGDWYSVPVHGHLDYGAAAQSYLRAGNLSQAHDAALKAAAAANDIGQFSDASFFLTIAANTTASPRRRTELILQQSACLSRGGHFRDAVTVLLPLGVGPDADRLLQLDIALARASAYGYARDYRSCLAHAHHASSLARSLDRPRELLNARRLVAEATCWCYDKVRGRRMLFRVIKEARRLAEPDVRASALQVLASSYWHEGSFSRTLKYLTRSRVGHGPNVAAMHVNIAVVLSDLGRYVRSRARLRALLSSWQSQKANSLSIRALNNVADTYRCQGRWLQAARAWSTTRRTGESVSERTLLIHLPSNEGIVHTHLGQFTTVIGGLRHLFRTLRQPDTSRDLYLVLHAWTTVLDGIGMHDTALAAARSADRFADKARSWMNKVEIHDLMAMTLLKLDRATEALAVINRVIDEYGERTPFDVRLRASLTRIEILLATGQALQAVRTDLDRALETARKHGMRWHRTKGLIILASALLKEGSTENVEGMLREAAGIARKNGDRHLFWQAHYRLGRLYEHQLRYERAHHCYRVGALTIHEMAMNIDEERYKRSFLAQRDIQEALECYERLRKEVGRRRRHDVAALSRSERTSRRMLGALSTIGQRLSAILDLDDLLQSILDLAVENVGAERGLIFLRDDISGEMRLACARGMDGAELDEASSFSRTIIQQAAQGQALLTVDVGKDATLSAYQSLVLHEIKSILCVPMRSRGTVMGVLYLDTQRATRLFTARERAFVESFANQAAVAIENARLFGALRSENVRLRREAGDRHRFENLVGGSPAMRRLSETIASVLANDSNVLILGDSGTGKELVARAIHYNGHRRDKPFIAVDCGALPETLLEAELFGHVRGAFTGADRDRRGLILEADGGTLFLDEITNTSPALQSKLLRVLQEREVRRVGENTTRRVDVRILAATNADILALVEGGRFRQDLYYRLNVMTIEVPSLRDRREDIPQLVEHFMKRAVARGQSPRALAPEVYAALARHDWPGNVRELENLVERLMALSPEAVILPGDLPEEYRLHVTYAGRTTPTAADGGRTGEQLMIEQALERFNGDKTKAARFIGWNRQKLYRRMRLFSIPSDYARTETHGVFTLTRRRRAV